MADGDGIRVIRNERGIGTGETRSGVEPRPDANGQLEPHGTARGAGIVSEPSGSTEPPGEGGGVPPGPGAGAGPAKR